MMKFYHALTFFAFIMLICSNIASGQLNFRNISEADEFQINKHKNYFLSPGNFSEKQDSESGSSFGIFGGVGYGAVSYYRLYDSVKSNITPETYIGLMAEFPIRKADERLFANVEMGVSHFESKSYNPHYVDLRTSTNGSYSELTRIFSPWQLNIAATLKYNITLTKFHPYAFVGINNNIIVSKQNELTEIIHYNDTAVTVYGKAIEKPATYGMCVLAGVGLEYERISLEFRYQSGRSFNVYTDNFSVFRPALFGILRFKILN